MKPHAIHYMTINLVGLAFAIVMAVCYTLYVIGKLNPKSFMTIKAIFGIVLVLYGVYVLSVADVVRVFDPGKYYSVGGWIVILIGIIILVPALFGLMRR